MKRFVAVALALIMVLSMAACGSSSEDTQGAGSGSEENTSGETTEVQHLVFACPGRSARYNFVNEDGELDGYEVALIKEVDNRLDDVEIELIYTGEFSALFPGLESGQYDIVGGGISWKQERADTYLYSEVPYFHSPTVLGVRQDEEEIKTIEDLAGKNIAHIAGTAQAMWLEAYNEANPDKAINIDYLDASSIEIMQMVYTGRYDACIHAAADFAIAKQELGVDLKTLEIENADEIQMPDSYYLYAKDNTELQQKIDGALAEIRDDGTMSELCIQYFGEDLVPTAE